MWSVVVGLWNYTVVFCSFRERDRRARAHAQNSRNWFSFGQQCEPKSNCEQCTRAHSNSRNCIWVFFISSSFTGRQITLHSIEYLQWNMPQLCVQNNEYVYYEPICGIARNQNGMNAMKRKLIIRIILIQFSCYTRSVRLHHIYDGPLNGFLHLYNAWLFPCVSLVSTHSW